jgi:hypothetical protein
MRIGHGLLHHNREGYVPVKGGALLQEPFRLERFGVIVALRPC